MADLVQNIVTRSGKGGPLTPTEMDNNLLVLQRAVNGLAARLGVTLNPDGTLKANALNSPSQISDSIITPEKLGFKVSDQLKSEAAAGGALDNSSTLAGWSPDGVSQTVTVERLMSFVTTGFVPGYKFLAEINVPAPGPGVSVNHYLPGTPQFVTATMQCVAEFYGFAVGEVLALEGFTTDYGYPAFSVSATRQSIYVARNKKYSGNTYFANRQSGEMVEIITDLSALKMLLLAIYIQ